jgi:hypothetical protein
LFDSGPMKRSVRLSAVLSLLVGLTVGLSACVDSQDQWFTMVVRNDTPNRVTSNEPDPLGPNPKRGLPVATLAPGETLRIPVNADGQLNPFPVLGPDGAAVGCLNFRFRRIPTVKSYEVSRSVRQPGCGAASRYPGALNATRSPR